MVGTKVFPLYVLLLATTVLLMDRTGLTVETQDEAGGLDATDGTVQASREDEWLPHTHSSGVTVHDPAGGMVAVSETPDGYEHVTLIAAPNEPASPGCCVSLDAMTASLRIGT